MIERIFIENYKSIKKLDINLNMINVLIGSNGAGKSNFISFFKFLSSITKKRLQNHVQEESGAQYVLHHGLKVSQEINSKVEITYGMKSVYYEFSLAPNTDQNLFFTSEYLGYRGAGYNKYYDYGLNIARGVETGLPTKEYELRNIEPIVIKRLNEYKVYHFHDTGKTALVKQFFNLYDNEMLYEDARNLASYLYKMKNKEPLVLEKIEKTIKLVAPYFDCFVLNPIGEEIRLHWREENSDMLFNANHFSDGTLRMICLITLFLQSNPPKTIILDEPELGLHPFALEILADLIKKVASKGIQTIISTQSISLVEKFNIEDIIVTNKENRESKLEHLDIKQLENWIDEYSIGELWEMNLLGGRP